jgi:long-chain acyl-CoA synthetase
LIYTSGTTGGPRACILVHDNWVYEAEASSRSACSSPTDKQFLWLPMSHSFGKVLEVVTIAGNVPHGGRRARPEEGRRRTSRS